MGLAFTPPPPAAISRILSTFSRDHLEGFIAVALDLLDLADGDPDFQQADGDELDFNAAEDDFCDHSGWKAEAGCPVSDPGEDDDPGGGNVDDEGEPTYGIEHPAYGIDQFKGPLSPHLH